MVATDVCRAQSAICEQKMKNIETKLDDLAEDVHDLKTDLKADIKDLQKTVKAVEQQSIRLDDRWKLVTVLAAILGAIGTFLGILDSLKVLFGG